MIKTLTLAAAILALSAPAALAAAKAPAATYKGQELAKQATISLANARAIALKARPGKITDQELEKEGGGSGLRYSFDVTSRGKSYEVGIDAMSGKVLENAVETAAQEKAEVRTERHEKEAHPQH
jgi:uncharacterized membrane protein YkoI